MHAEFPSVRPLHVLINGAPGSGKTTLAHQLAQVTSLPVVSRDAVRAGFAETFSASCASDRSVMNQRVVSTTWGIIERLLSLGVSVISDQACVRGLAEQDLQPLTRIARTVVVHCRTSPEIAQRRFIARSLRDGRQPVFGAGAAPHIERMDQGTFDLSAYEPLDLDVPTLMVDTIDGWMPDLDVIVAFVRRRSSAPGGQRSDQNR